MSKRWHTAASASVRSYVRAESIYPINVKSIGIRMKAEEALELIGILSALVHDRGSIGDIFLTAHNRTGMQITALRKIKPLNGKQKLRLTSPAKTAKIKK